MKHRAIRRTLYVLLVMLLLSACSRPAPQAATAVPQAAEAVAPTAVAPTAVPPTVAPSPTAEPSPTPQPPTPQPSPTPQPAAAAMPDARQDPQAALMYSATSGAVKSATFTYEMKMTTGPADEASKQAMGPAADMLSKMEMKGSGSGALEIVDAATSKANMHLVMDMSVMSQKIKVETVTRDGAVWTRTNDGEWKKAESKAAAAESAGGMDPSSMLEAYKSATKVEWLDDEPLNDEPVHHLRFSLDPSKMDMSAAVARAQGGDATPEQLKALLQKMTVDAEVWLRAEDLALRQQRVLMSFTMPMPGSETKDVGLKIAAEFMMHFDKLNEPVDIPAPTGS